MLHWDSSRISFIKHVTFAGKQACFPEPVCSNSCCGRFQVIFPNQASKWRVYQLCLGSFTVKFLSRVRRKEPSCGCSLWVLCGGRQINVHPVFPSTACDLDIPRMGIVTIQCQDNGIFLRKLHKTDKTFKHCVKIIFVIHPALWQAAVESGGALSRSSAFMLLVENTRRWGTYVTVVFIRVAIVTSEPLSAEDKQTNCLPLREIILHTLCWWQWDPFRHSWISDRNIN